MGHTMPRHVVRSLREARHVVIFTGAGMSAESGVPTFRDALTGLWERCDVQALATPQAFHDDPALVWGWYEWRRALVEQVQPNPGHLAVSEISSRVPHSTVITQNVDALHDRRQVRPGVVWFGEALPACVGAHTLEAGHHRRPGRIVDR